MQKCRTIYSNIRTTHKYGNYLQIKIEKYITTVCTYIRKSEIVYLAWVGGSCVVGRGPCVSNSQKNLKPNYTMNCQNFARIFLAMPHLY